MIENILTVVIKELGATGLMLFGLYFILMRVGKMIATHLYVINHNTTKISELIEIFIKKYYDK
jgi:hypothetical protein